MTLQMSRRNFVKASALAASSALLLDASTALADDAENVAPESEGEQIIPSACRQCYGRCALYGHVKDGRLVKVEGNPDLFNEGTLCGRAFAIPQELYNPTRIRYPQKRVGERGEGKWKRITWEEAFEEARDRFTEIGETYGWHTIAHQYGTGRDNHQFQAINRMWLELGSTSTFGVGNLCWLGSYFTSQRLYGDETQYTGWDGNNADCILQWCRQERSRGYYDWLVVKRAQKRGAKTILVDPRYTCTASKVDLWLPIRPGSDMALALAFINEIVHSDKCATDFARYYTNAPFFIDEEGTGYQLRESLIKEGGNEELYLAWDEAHDRLVYWNGDWQNSKGLGEDKIFKWLDESGNIVEDARPALSGSHEINGKTYRTSWDILVEHVTPWTIEPPITKRSRPDLLEEYPYTLITGGRSHAFFHTEYRNSPWMREVHMFPTVDINPETAAKHGIEQDDWVWIETYVDRIRQRANLTASVRPDTIHVEHDWWFPEREASDDLHGAFDCNCNVLFENDGPYDPAVGTDNYGGLCKIYKAEEGAPKGICMTEKDLEIFLPLSPEEMEADGQQDGVVYGKKGGAK